MASTDRLLDFYKKTLEEKDSKNYSSLFKLASEEILKDLTEEHKCTPIDIVYKDGYFIFARGTNSIVHFKIKECPGWLFGIWWDEPEEDKEFITGEFFTQFEKSIDKFKPSASTYCEHLRFDFKVKDGIYVPGEYNYIGRIQDTVKFIRKHRVRAWYRDAYAFDYNIEYKSTISIYFNFLTRKMRWFIYSKVQQFLNSVYKRYIEKNIIPHLPDGIELVDLGEYCYPRFELRLGLDEDVEEDVVGLPEELCDKLSEVEKILNKLGDPFEGYISKTHRAYLVYKKEK